MINNIVPHYNKMFHMLIKGSGGTSSDTSEVEGCVLGSHTWSGVQHVLAHWGANPNGLL